MAVGETADSPRTGSGGQPLSSFEFDGRPPWLGIPVVNGHQMLTVSAIDVHMGANEIPAVTLTLPAADALRLILGGNTALVKVSGETREALISLGWTPPDGDPEYPEAAR